MKYKVFRELLDTKFMILFGLCRSIFIEKGRPADWERDEREISGSVVHVTSFLNLHFNNTVTVTSNCLYMCWT